LGWVKIKNITQALGLALYPALGLLLNVNMIGANNRVANDYSCPHYLFHALALGLDK
jgi:predicted DNA-binding ArsR family transcriptional regulator